MSEPDLAAILTVAAKDLQKPAGDDFRFSSLESIQVNREEFVLRRHETWKRWHYKAIDEILTFDAIARAEKEKPIGHGVKGWTEYERSLWRKVNDSIVWSIAGRERHVVKRLCLYRDRGHLAESNAESALRVLEHYNANPMSMAIWNDATSCVDVGDITLIENGMLPLPAFLEIKEGDVNAEIVEMMKLKDQKEIIARLDEFFKRRGESGMKQIDRIIRQSERDNQLLSLLREDKGFDPVSEREIEVIDQLEQDLEDYDTELRALFDEVEGGASEAWSLVDGCLWLYVNSDVSLGLNAVRERFRDIIGENSPQLKDALKGSQPRWDVGRLASLNEGFSLPMALPLFLRGISPGVIGEIAAGKLMHRVYLYLDWNRFGDLIRGEGAEFRWSSEKEARRGRAQPFPVRNIVAHGRIPRVVVGKVTASVTGPNLVQMYFDGLRPRSLAKLVVDTSRKLGLRTSGQV